jgi:hypothetical protein
MIIHLTDDANARVPKAHCLESILHSDGEERREFSAAGVASFRNVDVVGASIRRNT